MGKNAASAAYRFGIDYVEVTARSPQVLRSLAPTAGRGFQFFFGDADGTPSSVSNASNFNVQTSTDLASRNWTSATGNLVLTNQEFLWTSADPTNSPRRFFRVLEK